MKKLLRLIKLLAIIIGVITVSLSVIVCSARFINYQKTKIRTPNGIQESSYINVNKIKQYVQIRGKDKNNPIIVVIHGGPGTPISAFSTQWQTSLESDYTIVNYDQRGSGRTYFANDEDAIKDISLDLLISDLDKTIDKLCTKFNKQKVIIMGHSWGSVIGSLYSQEHPQKVESYIGVGQVINASFEENIAAQKALREAHHTGSHEDIWSIKNAYKDFFDSLKHFNINTLTQLHNITDEYLPHGESDSILALLWIALTSPNLGFDDIKWYAFALLDFDNYASVNLPLWKRLYGTDEINMYKYKMNYDVPIYFISGSDDWSTSPQLARYYMSKITAPNKSMAILNHTGHSPFFDNPNKFCSTLKSLLSRNPR